ncbi:MAG TPA: hypothetical protein VGJ12_15660 [Gemmatimonadaceae bacterium]
MRKMQIPAALVALFFSMSMASTRPLHAQTQAAAPAAAAANEKYVLCSADPTGPVAYINQIFAAVMPHVAASGMRGGVEKNENYALQPLFLAFHRKKYGSNYQGQLSCLTTFTPNAAGLHAAQSQKQRLEDLAKQNKAQIVETDWKYTP